MSKIKEDTISICERSFFMNVKDVMTQDVFSVDANESILKAAQIMRDTNVGSVPVRQGDQVVGIITDRDIVIRNVANQKDANTSCKEVMSSQIVSCTPDTDVHEAARIMAQHQVRRIPVVDRGSLVGMVALGDLATTDILQNEAGEALSNISTPSIPNLQ